MSEEKKTLFGFPIVETNAVSKGTVILGPMPTAEDLRRYGAYEKYVQAKKHEFAMLKLDDEILSANEIQTLDETKRERQALIANDIRVLTQQLNERMRDARDAGLTVSCHASGIHNIARGYYSQINVRILTEV